MLDNDVYITDKETNQRYMYYIDLLWIGICKCEAKFISKYNSITHKKEWKRGKEKLIDSWVKNDL